MDVKLPYLLGSSFSRYVPKGMNPEKNAVRVCMVELNDFISSYAMDVANALLARGLMPLELHEKVVRQPEIAAGELVDYLVDRVRVNAGDFQKILDVLSEVDCSEDIVRIIEEKYGKLA